MVEHQDGGPAFASLSAPIASNPGDFVYVPPGWSGMSLRDYFAAKAVSGMAADESVVMDFPEMARWCYGFADAMLSAREGEPATPVKYALRHKGTHEFVSKLPHDFLEENFVQGWTHPCMLTWDTEEDAEKTRAGDPDGASLCVEEVELQS